MIQNADPGLLSKLFIFDIGVLIYKNDIINL